MSDVAFQSYGALANYGTLSSSASQTHSSSGASLQQLFDFCIVLLLKSLVGQMSAGQANQSANSQSDPAGAGNSDSSASCPCCASSCGAQSAPTGANGAQSSGDTFGDDMGSLLELITDVLLKLMENTQPQPSSNDPSAGQADSGGAGEANVMQLLAQILEIVLTMQEQGQQGAGGQTNGSSCDSGDTSWPDAGSDASWPGAGSSSGASSGMSNDTLMALLLEVLQVLKTLLQGGQSQNDGGGQSAGASADPASALQNILELLQGMGASQSDSSGGGSAGLPVDDSAPSGNGTNNEQSDTARTGIQHLTRIQPDTASSNAPDSGATNAGASTTSTGNSAQSGNDAKAIVENDLSSDFNASPNVKLAILANMYHETGSQVGSSLKADVNEGGQIGAPNANVDEDNAHGYGLVQLTGAEKKAFLDYCNANGKNPQDAHVQMEYLDKHDARFQSVIQQMKDADAKGASLDELTTMFSTNFERPADPELQSRLNDAHALAAQG